MLRRNVLIFHQAALGDFIVTWPLAMALSRVFPQSRIIYVTHSQKGALAERVLRIESADVEGGWHALHVSQPQFPELPDRSARLLQGAHTLVTFTAGQPDSLAQSLAHIVPHAQLISLDTRLGGDLHVTESIRGQLHAHPALAAAMQQMLRSIAARGVGYRLAPQGRIVIHPGAGKQANRWPAERFVELARRLRERGRRVCVLLGEVEIEKWPSDLIRRFEIVAAIERPATLLDLLDQIASASLFVGNDSGPGHLAGILGVPTLSLFGQSDPARWHPLGPSVQVLQGRPIDTIQVDEVLRRLTGRQGGNNAHGAEDKSDRIDDE